MAILDWPTRWDALRSACQHRNATGRWAKGRANPPRFDIDPPAAPADVAAIEESLRQPLPPSFRRVLLEYSSAVCIEWEVADEARGTMPDVFREIWAGECRWDLSAIASLVATYQEWLTIFTDPNDKYDGPWQNKFPVLEVCNGDMIAVDISTEATQPVVYLSHEGDDTVHGFWLGRDYEDYIDRLTLLGCVGAEDWQLAPFLPGPRTYLDTDGDNAKLWRDWFGLHLRV
jgi:hypothetical protein